jgi:hypothetical protein
MRAISVITVVEAEFFPERTEKFLNVGVKKV